MTSAAPQARQHCTSRQDGTTARGGCQTRGGTRRADAARARFPVGAQFTAAWRTFRNRGSGFSWISAEIRWASLTFSTCRTTRTSACRRHGDELRGPSAPAAAGTPVSPQRAVPVSRPPARSPTQEQWLAICGSACAAVRHEDLKAALSSPCTLSKPRLRSDEKSRLIVAQEPGAFTYVPLPRG